MWFKKDPYKSIKKTDLYNKIIDYGKDTYELLQLALHASKPRIEEITLEDIKSYYKAMVEPQNSLYRRMETMKALRKFFRWQSVGLNFRPNDIKDDMSLDYVGGNVTLEPMKKIDRRGRPVDMEMVKKVKFLKDNGDLTFREVAAIVKKDIKRVHQWYHYPKGFDSAKKLAKKFSTV